MVTPFGLFNPGFLRRHPVWCLCQFNRDFGRALSQKAGIFPDRNRLGAKRNTVKGGVIAILTGNRNALHALCGKGGHNATRRAVIRGDNGVNLVIGSSQELFHVALGDGWLPAIGIGFADNLDIAAIDCCLKDFKLAFMQDIGVRVGRCAFDEDVIAFRLLATRLRPEDGRLPLLLNVM